MDLLDAYRTQSTFSDPGRRAAMLDAVPADLAAIRQAITPLVFHYRGGGDWAENGIAQERWPEIDLRYADEMWGRIGELSPKPIGETRAPHERMIGCCRDFTLLFVSLARHKGIPARSRVGFATYFAPGYACDHVVAETWDQAEQRWRLIDAELRPGYVNPSDGMALDAMDLPRDRFIVAPDAWLRCREGGDDPERYLVSPSLEIPGLRGWPYILHNVVQDLAALNKREMILWDDWGISAEWETLTDAQRATVDEAARTMMSPDVSLTELQELYARDEFRVPETVASWTSAVAEPPVQVTLRG